MQTSYRTLRDEDDDEEEEDKEVEMEMPREQKTKDLASQGAAFVKQRGGLSLAVRSGLCYTFEMRLDRWQGMAESSDTETVLQVIKEMARVRLCASLPTATPLVGLDEMRSYFEACKLRRTMSWPCRNWCKHRTTAWRPFLTSARFRRTWRQTYVAPSWRVCVVRCRADDASPGRKTRTSSASGRPG